MVDQFNMFVYPKMFMGAFHGKRDLGSGYGTRNKSLIFMGLACHLEEITHIYTQICKNAA